MQRTQCFIRLVNSKVGMQKDAAGHADTDAIDHDTYTTIRVVGFQVRKAINFFVAVNAITSCQ